MCLCVIWSHCGDNYNEQCSKIHNSTRANTDLLNRDFRIRCHVGVSILCWPVYKNYIINLWINIIQESIYMNIALISFKTKKFQTLSLIFLILWKTILNWPLDHYQNTDLHQEIMLEPENPNKNSCGSIFAPKSTICII